MTDARRPYAELAALTEAALAGLRDGEASHLAAFAERRAALIERLRDGGAPADVAALTRLLDLDRELLALVEREKARIGDELSRLSKCRQLLGSYRGAAPRSAVYIERLG